MLNTLSAPKLRFGLVAAPSSASNAQPLPASDSPLLKLLSAPQKDSFVKGTVQPLGSGGKNPFELISCPERPLLMMSDYDGTLNPAMKNYRDSFLSPYKLNIVRNLALQPDVMFSIISGRPLDQLLDIFGSLEGTPMFLVGSHGGEIYNLETGTYIKRPSLENQLKSRYIMGQLKARGVFSLPGVECETKRGSFTIHYDNASEESVDFMKLQVQDILESNSVLSDSFTTRNGKKVFEVIPKDFNKGKAVLSLLPFAQKRFGVDIPIHTVYSGDDISDYDAMKVVKALGGCTFLVTKTPKPETSPFVTTVIPGSHQLFQYFRSTIQDSKESGMR